MSTAHRRWRRVGLAVCIVALIVVWFCLRLHWQLISVAAFIIIAGTALSLLFEKWEERNWRRWGQAVFIGIVLAVGALVTTHGWNLRDNYLRDRGLLIAAAVEWRLNKTYIHVQSQRRDEYLIRGGQFSTPIFVLPTARETRQVLTQATSFRNEEPLIRALTLYALAVDKLAPQCEHIDRICSQPIAAMETKKSIVKTELGKDKNSSFQYFIEAHEQLGKILASSYSWSLDEAEVRLAKDLLDAIESTWLNVTLDPNTPR